MRGSKKFCQRGFNFDNVFFFLSFIYFFLLMRRGRIHILPYKRDIIDLPAKMAFRWRADDGPTLIGSLVAL